LEKRNPRILLADDELHIRKMMGAVIKSMGFDVVAEAANGNEAVELFFKEKPDIALLDINMPIKTGTEALKEIIAASPDACVIMLTSVSDLETVQEVINLGAAQYIRKDMQLFEIKKIVAETWQERNQD
jgi:two-component system, chemotaxis family, chemotaxis protein CheY